MEKKNNHQSNKKKQRSGKKATKSISYVQKSVLNLKRGKKNHKSTIGNENKVTNVKINEKKNGETNAKKYQVIMSVRIDLVTAESALCALCDLLCGKCVQYIYSHKHFFPLLIRESMCESLDSAVIFLLFSCSTNLNRTRRITHISIYSNIYRRILCSKLLIATCRKCVGEFFFPDRFSAQKKSLFITHEW